MPFPEDDPPYYDGSCHRSHDFDDSLAKFSVEKQQISRRRAIGDTFGDISLSFSRRGVNIVGKTISGRLAARTIKCRDISANLYNGTERLGKQGNKLSLISGV